MVPDPTDQPWEDWLIEMRRLRIAFVRQDVYRDLYCCDPKLPGSEIVRQSVRRTGPAGLLADLKADYWVVREDAAPECSVWTEKIAHDPDLRPEAYRAQKDCPPAPGFRTCFAQHSVGVDDIPWEQYDLVISMDISVPFRIVEGTRRPLWAYLPGDPGVPTAKKSLRQPPGPYDVSLTHSFRRHPVRPGLGPRAVEFPYTFLRRATWNRIFPSSSVQRKGTMVEHQTEKLLSKSERQRLEKIGPVRRPEGTILEVAERINQSAFYFRCGGGPIVGNGIVEAAAAGCLAVGNAGEFVSRSLFSRPNICACRPDGLKRIQELYDHPKDLTHFLALQGQLVDYYCFYRPIRDILRLWKLKNSSGNRRMSFPCRRESDTKVPSR